ncbi:phosphotransferase [Nonomuraea sp. NPDC050451]|uniref:phosphotransferase n=1 Tax=Nonomuraea sp. NPDC050451 TaxID=3364364 RepID=UPI00378ED7FE
MAVWDAAPDWAGPALWLHGDLHPANVLTADGTICGVIDFGALFAGASRMSLPVAMVARPGIDLSDMPRMCWTRQPKTSRGPFGVLWRSPWCLLLVRH